MENKKNKDDQSCSILPTDLSSPSTFPKPNSLIQLNKFVGDMQGSSPSLIQLKMFDYSLIHAHKNDEGKLISQFPLVEFCRHCGICSDYALGGSQKKIAEDALQDLSNKSGWVMKTNPVTGKKEKVLVRLVAKPRIELEGQNIVTIVYDEDLAPAIEFLAFQNKGFYTLLDRQDPFIIRNKYGYILYQLLVSYENVNTRQKYSFIDLAEKFDAGSYLKSPRNFKNWVIDIAVSAINEVSRIFQVSVEYEKTGRSFSHAIFTLTRKIKDGQEKVVFNAFDDTVKEVHKQIDYDAIRYDIEKGIKNYDLTTLDLIVEIISETLESEQKTFYINQANISVSKIKEAFRRLDMFHVCFAMDQLKEAKSIKSPRKYVRSVLYNTLNTMDLQIQSKVNNDVKEKPDAGSKYKERMLDSEEIEAIRRMMELPD